MFSLKSILTEIQSLGGKTQIATKRFWGGYSGYFQDLDGHYWEVAFNPYTLPNDDGTYQIEE